MKKIQLLFACLLFAAANGQNPVFDWGHLFVSPKSLVMGLHMASDKHGNVFVQGVFGDTLDFDPGPATATLGALPPFEIYISKFDSAGNFLWVKHLTGGIFNYNATSIHTDSQGNLLVMGNGSAGLDLDPGPGAFVLTGADNTYLLKLDAQGNFLWAEVFSGADAFYSPCFTVDDNDNIVIGAMYDAGAIDVDPGPGTYTLPVPPVNNISCFVLKLDASAGFKWATVLGSSNDDELRINAIVTDLQGNVIVNGSFFQDLLVVGATPAYSVTSAGSADIFAARLSATGQFRWLKTAGGAGLDFGSEVVTDPHYNIYLSGTFNSNIDFDFGPATSSVNAWHADCSFLLKVDTSGAFKWVRTNTGFMHMHDDNRLLALDGNNNIYLSSQLMFSGPLFPGSSQSYQVTDGGGLLLKYDSLGNVLWSGQVGGDSEGSIYAVMRGIQGQVFVCGDTEGSFMDVDPNTTAHFQTANKPESVAFLISLQQYCQAPDSLEVHPANTICSGKQAEITATGNATYHWYNNQVYFASGSSVTTAVLPTGTYFYQVNQSTAYCSAGSYAHVEIKAQDCTGLTEQQNLPLKVFPNPGAGIFIVELYSHTSEISVFNMSGKMVRHIKNVTGSQQVDLNGEAAGIYLLRVISDDGSSQQSKLILGL